MPGDRDRSLLHFDASDRRLSGYAWDFPTVVDGRPLVCRGIYRLKIDGDRTEDGVDVGVLLDTRLRAQGIDPSRCKNKRYAERGYERGARIARGRLMLVGEASGIDPVTGEGIAQAIEYGTLAGAFLARHLPAGSGSPDLTDVEAWQAHVARLTARTRSADPNGLHAALLRRRATGARARDDRHAGQVFIGCQHFAAHSQDLWKVAEVVALGAARLLTWKIGQALGRKGLASRS